MPAPPRHRIGVMTALVAFTLSAVAVTTQSAGADQISDMRAEAATIASKLDDQASRIVALDIQRRQAQARLDDANAEITQTQAQLAAAVARQDDLKKALVASAQDAYVTGGTVTVLKYLIETQKGDGGSRDVYLSLVTGQYRDVIDALRATREDLAGLEAQLTAAQKDARQRAAAIATAEGALSQASDLQRAQLQQVNGQLAQLVAAEQARRDAAAAAAQAAAAQAAAAKPSAAKPSATPQLVAPTDTFACIRELESGNNYSSPGGGAYQFLDSTWHALGYTGTASDAPPAVQDAAAHQLQAEDGWSPWTTAPLCGR